MNERERIDDYQYLWDGSQPGWVLKRLCGHYVALSLSFTCTGPSKLDIMAVRRVVPEYRSLPFNQLISQLRGRQSLPLGQFASDEARKIAAVCRQEGLAVVEERINAPRCLLINEITGVALTIEDEELANQVWTSAERHGVPVRHVEF